MGATAGAISAALLATVLAGCSAPDEPGASPEPPTTVAAQPARVPELCDNLVSTVTLTEALRRRLPTARSYARLQPDPGVGRGAGLRCEYGVAADGPVLTVLASQFQSPHAAHTALRRPAYAATTRTTSLAGLPAVLVAGVSSTTLRALDADIVVQTILPVGLVPSDRAEPVLRTITERLVAALDEGQA